MEILLSKVQLQLTLKRLAHQLLEEVSDYDNIVFIGLQPRGIQVANRIIEIAKELAADKPIHYAVLDITFYRDDIRNELHIPRETNLLQSIEGKKVILIDDVLYTGRTIRAALDALQDFGRPQIVALCVLINRRFSRELPIQPDFCGMAIDTNPGQKVKVEWDREEVILY
ncbi:MAG: bifunctional pyr operon transcriptional regulator/uracil phosphoribosyltransferase PyrR [Ferruginibacter sp.]